MASIRRRVLPSGKPRWDVSYRLPGQRRLLQKTFDTEKAARSFRSQVEADADRGLEVDPRRQRVTVFEWCRSWLAGKTNLAPSTRERYEGLIETHIKDRWERVLLAHVKHAQVQSWISGLDLSPASVRKAHRVLSQALDYAVKDGRLAINPARGVSLPRVQEAPRLFLDHGQVDALADACGEYYRLLVLFLAYTGLRWGELAALRVGQLDLGRRRAAIVESVTPVRGVMTFGPVKNHERREVPIPRFLVDELRAHVAGLASSDLVFIGERGAVLRSQTFQKAALDEAAASLGLDGFTPHMLRHTAASLAIAAGADVKVVQTMLGHKSATMTLDLYGHLFPDRLDVVSDAMEAARELWMQQGAA